MVKQKTKGRGQCSPRWSSLLLNSNTEQKELEAVPWEGDNEVEETPYALLVYRYLLLRSYYYSIWHRRYYSYLWSPASLTCRKWNQAMVCIFSFYLGFPSFPAPLIKITNYSFLLCTSFFFQHFPKFETKHWMMVMMINDVLWHKGKIWPKSARSALIIWQWSDELWEVDVTWL